MGKPLVADPGPPLLTEEQVKLFLQVLRDVEGRMAPLEFQKRYGFSKWGDRPKWDDLRRLLAAHHRHEEWRWRQIEKLHGTLDVDRIRKMEQERDAFFAGIAALRTSALATVGLMVARQYSDDIRVHAAGAEVGAFIGTVGTAAAAGAAYLRQRRAATSTGRPASGRPAPAPATAESTARRSTDESRPRPEQRATAPPAGRPASEPAPSLQHGQHTTLAAPHPNVTPAPARARPAAPPTITAAQRADFAARTAALQRNGLSDKRIDKYMTDVYVEATRLAQLATKRAADEKGAIARGDKAAATRARDDVRRARDAADAYRSLQKYLRTVWFGMQDPKLLAQVGRQIEVEAANIVRLKQPLDPDVKSVATQAVINLSTRRAGPVQRVHVLEENQFFDGPATGKRRFLDHGVAPDHGKTAHLIQDLVVDAALARAGAPMRSEQFRQLLGRADASARAARGEARTENSPRGLGQQIWENLLNDRIDEPQGKVLHRPETLSPTMRILFPDLE
jgi:hypothetical protein